ncbi:MAG: hypothetical protein ACK55Z_07000, partial [bacterium]
MQAISYVEMGGCPSSSILSLAVSHNVVAEHPAPPRKRPSWSLAHLSSMPAFTSVAVRPKSWRLLVSLSSASLNFSAWPLFMDAFSRFISSVGVSPLMKPDDSSRRMGNLPRRTSMSASVRMACSVPLLLGSGS